MLTVTGRPDADELAAVLAVLTALTARPRSTDPDRLAAWRDRRRAALGVRSQHTR